MLLDLHNPNPKTNNQQDQVPGVAWANTYTTAKKQMIKELKFDTKNW
jgi:hypothetical protein